MPNSPEPADRRIGRPPTTIAMILAELVRTDRPLKGAALARRCGRQYSGHFREALGSIVEEGLAVTIDGEYWLTSRQRAAV